jgi:hypothetical protein
MRQMYRELTRGLAVVPTIDALLHHIREKKSAATPGAGAGAGKESITHMQGITPQQQKRYIPPSQRHTTTTTQHRESISTVGQRARLLSHQPPPQLSSHFQHDDSCESPQEVAHTHSLNHSAADSSRGPISPIVSSVGHRMPRHSGSIGARNDSPLGSYRDRLLPSSSADTGEVSVRLSSRDPNVQLAWVLRTIATTRVTSFAVIFSTVPFLVLNQIELLRSDGENAYRSRWAINVSSLFAAVLLGVKLMRILSLGELIQRRNELVFEVLTYGVSSSTIAGNGSGGGSGGNMPSTPAHHHHHSGGRIIPHEECAVNMTTSFTPSAVAPPSYLPRESRLANGGGGYDDFSLPHQPSSYAGGVFSDEYGGDEDEEAARADSYPATHLLAPSSSFAPHVYAEETEGRRPSRAVPPSSLSPLDEWAHANDGSTLSDVPAPIALSRFGRASSTATSSSLVALVEESHFVVIDKLQPVSVVALV